MNYGAHVRLSQYGHQLLTMAGLLGYIGTTHARIALRWSEIEPQAPSSPHTYTYDDFPSSERPAWELSQGSSTPATVNEQLQVLSNAGLTILGILGKTPDWWSNAQSGNRGRPRDLCPYPGYPDARNTVTTTLAASVDSSSTSVQVNSLVDFPGHGCVKLKDGDGGWDYIHFAWKETVGTDYYLRGCRRTYNVSDNPNFSSGDDVEVVEGIQAYEESELDSGIDSSQTSGIVIKDGRWLPNSGQVWIGKERIEYTGVSRDNPSANKVTLTGVTRGDSTSNPVWRESHSADDLVWWVFGSDYYLKYVRSCVQHCSVDNAWVEAYEMWADTGAGLDALPPEEPWEKTGLNTKLSAYRLWPMFAGAHRIIYALDGDSQLSLKAVLGNLQDTLQSDIGVIGGGNLDTRWPSDYTADSDYGVTDPHGSSRVTGAVEWLHWVYEAMEDSSWEEGERVGGHLASSKDFPWDAISTNCLRWPLQAGKFLDDIGAERDEHEDNFNSASRSPIWVAEFSVCESGTNLDEVVRLSSQWGNPNWNQDDHTGPRPLVPHYQTAQVTKELLEKFADKDVARCYYCTALPVFPEQHRINAQTLFRPASLSQRGQATAFREKTGMMSSNESGWV